MSGEITVTPGKTWGNEAITAAKLDATGNPTAKVDANSIGTTELIAADVNSLVVNAARSVNFFTNGDFRKEAWDDASGVSCAAGENTENARGWFVRPSGGAVQVARSTATPATSPLTLDALEITGAVGAASVVLGQWFPSSKAFKFSGGNFTISFRIYNNSGAAFVPQLRIQSADTEDGTVRTAVKMVNLASCGNAAWTTISVTVDGSTVTGMERGAVMEVIIPSPSLDAGGKTVRFVEMQFESGSSASTFINEDPKTEVRTMRTATGAPTVNDDELSGYAQGSTWLDVSAPQWYVCTSADTGAAVWTEVVQTLQPTDYLLFEDRKTIASAGGGFTSGAWQDRAMNTEVKDTGGHGSVDGATGKITLASGQYKVSVRCPAFRVEKHVARLWDDDAGAVLLEGGNAHSDSAGNYGQTDAWITGHITLASTTVVKIQHQCTNTRATDGFGRAGGMTAAPAKEVYTQAEFTRIGE